jgi:hypothetical protein
MEDKFINKLQMSSSSSLSSARRRRVGAQQSVQNLPISSRDARPPVNPHGNPQQGNPQQGNPQQGNPQQGNPQQGNPQGRINNQQPVQRQQNIQRQQPGQNQRPVQNQQPGQNPQLQSRDPRERGNVRMNNNMPVSGTNEPEPARPQLNPAQLLMQHDYRLFQMEKMVKTLHDNTSKTTDVGTIDQDVVVQERHEPINMEEIKGAVSDSIYASDKLSTIVKEVAAATIESSYDFDSFFNNLQLLSRENQSLKDNLLSHQKYTNEMNMVLLKMLSEFREFQGLLKVNPSILATITEAEELIEDMKVNEIVVQEEAQGEAEVEADETAYENAIEEAVQEAVQEAGADVEKEVDVEVEVDEGVDEQEQEQEL